jgi:hypothetical protein
MTTLEGREAAFTARIAADATHEMRNVLAIVKESAGLIEDILRACDNGAEVDRDRVARTLGRIDAQVGRGAELMTHLNRFAHSLERKRERIELGREVEQAVFLGRRAAGKRRIVLSGEVLEDAPSFVADSFRVQMAISTALEWWLARLPEGTRVLVRAGGTGRHPAVEITGQEGVALPIPLPAGSPAWAELLGLLDGLGATAEVGDGERILRVLVAGEE